MSGLKLQPDSSMEEPDIVYLTPSKKINSSEGFKKPSPVKDWARNLKRSRGKGSDTFWYAAQATTPPSNYTPGMYFFQDIFLE